MSMNLYVACPSKAPPHVDDVQRVAKENGIELVIPMLDWQAQSGFLPMFIDGRKSGVEVDVWTGRFAAELIATFGLPESGVIVAMTWHGDLAECACAFAFAGAVAAVAGGTILDPNHDEWLNVSDAFRESKHALIEMVN
jgi:hypothetical protein